jgi:protein-S-isoprenylcysteine O-methyltransferase Ste14
VYQSWIIAGYVGFLFVITHSFVLFYEEPTLRRLFGVDYLDYCARVRR